MRPGQVAVIKLSPSGSHVAYALRTTGSNVDVVKIVAVDVEGDIVPVRTMRLVADSDGARVSDLRWVGKKWLIAEIASDWKERLQLVTSGYGSYLHRANRGRLYSFSAIEDGPANALDERLDAGSILEVPASDPESVIVQARANGRHNVYRLDMATGELTLLQTGDSVTCCWRVVGGQAVQKVNWPHYRNVMQVFTPVESCAGEWAFRREYETSEALSLVPAIVGKSPVSTGIYIRMPRPGTDHDGIHEFDLATGEIIATVVELAGYDVQSALIVGDHIVAATFIDDRARQVVPDPVLRAHYAELEARFGMENSVEFVGASDLRNRLLLRVSGPRQPHEYHVYDVNTRRTARVTDDRPWLDSERLAPAIARSIRTRDDARITAYLTCPGSPTETPRPLVVMPPEGPWTRSLLEFNPKAQAFASRGWCVLEPNYRGVYGYGRGSQKAGMGQWSGTVANDILDATYDAIAAGIADRDRIAVFSVSVGGYAALAGAIDDPGMYRACVTRDAATDLDLAINALRMRYMKSSPLLRDWMRYRGRESRKQSPLARASDLACPTLLIHQRGVRLISIAHSEALVNAMHKSGGKVESLWLPDDDTWSAHADNDVGSIQAAVSFFAPHMQDRSSRASWLPPEVAPVHSLPPITHSPANCTQLSAVDRAACLGRIRIKMPLDEIVGILGRPDATSRDGTVLRYGDRYLRFEADGKLAQISDQPQ